MSSGTDFRMNDSAIVLIKNLDKSIDRDALSETFSSFGNILSCEIVTDPSDDSKGYGYVQFDKNESAQNAINALNGEIIKNKKVYVGLFQRKQDRLISSASSSSEEQYTNVFVKNLSKSVTEENLKETFGKYGTITSAVILRDVNGESMCQGFVDFKNTDDADKAIEGLNAKKFQDKEWRVGKDETKADQFLRLYVKNLDHSIDDDEQLRVLFNEFGTAITSCKVLRDPNGDNNKRSGIVKFTTKNHAMQARCKMDGKVIADKCLHVTFGKTKEQRQAEKQIIDTQIQHLPHDPFQFSNMEEVGKSPDVAQSLATTVLVNAHPDLQTIMRQALFSLVHQEEPKAANEVTKMILEMYPSEVPYLIESPNDLKIKIAETMHVLRNVDYQNLDDN